MGATVTIPYTPRPYQQEIHDNLKRFNVLVLHRRAGKTVLAINQLVRDVLTCKLKRPRGAYIAPLYSQAKRVAWDYLREYCSPIPGVKFNESELRADLPNNGRIQLAGADNPDNMRGMYFDSVILDEVAQMAPRTWTEVVRPALADRKGKAIFIGTPQGKNAFYKFYEGAADQPDWYRKTLTVDDTGALDKEEIEAARRDMSEDEFAQEFYCSWSAAIRGAYYSTEIGEARAQGRICRVPWEPNYGVYTFWDLGISDATAIWFVQVINREIRAISYREWTDTSMAEVIKAVKELPYTYERHYGPHDLEVRDITHGRTRRDFARGLGIDFDVVKKTPIADGIEAGRVLMRRVWIDEKGCDQGIVALEQYRKDWDDKRQVFRDHPLHDWTSHCADAWRYFAVAFDDLIRPSMSRTMVRTKRAIR